MGVDGLFFFRPSNALSGLPCILGPVVKWLASLVGSKAESELGLLLCIVFSLEEPVMRPPLLFDVVKRELGLSLFKAVFRRKEESGRIEDNGRMLVFGRLSRLDDVPGRRDSILS